MMHAVRGIYRSGIVELLETPEVAENAAVVVTFLGARDSLMAIGDATAGTIDDAQPLEDLEPIVPMKPIRLSDLVLEGRE
jgi:hypothetical protein